MDRVKAQASQLAQITQEAAQEGRAKIDQAQASRRGDMLLRQLGVLVFAERTGRGTPDSQEKIEQAISEISAHETQYGLNLSDQPQSPFGQSPWSQAPAGQPPGPEPGAPAGPQTSTVPDPGTSPPAPAGPPPAGPQTSTVPDPGTTPPLPDPSFPGPGPDTGEGLPSVDTTTSFFPAPDEDAGPSGSPRG
jgi:hypothetical protein